MTGGLTGRPARTAGVVAAVWSIAILANLPYALVELPMGQVQSIQSAGSGAIVDVDLRGGPNRIVNQNSEGGVGLVTAGFPVERGRWIYGPLDEDSRGDAAVARMGDDEAEGSDLRTPDPQRSGADPRPIIAVRTSPAAVATNVCFWMVVTVAVLWLVFCPAGPTSLWHRRVRDAFVPAMIVTAPLVWIGHHQWRSHRQELLIERLGPGSSCEFATFVPRWAIHSLPQQAVALMREIRSVSVRHPTDSLLADIMRQPMLMRLQVSRPPVHPAATAFDGHSTADAPVPLLVTQGSRLDPAPASRVLPCRGDASGPIEGSVDDDRPPNWIDVEVAQPVSVVWSGPVPERWSEFLDRQRQILQLRMRHTKLTSATLRSVASLPTLRHLDLSYSRFPDDGINDPVWRESVRSLTLPTGQRRYEVLRASGFPNLSKLQLINVDAQRKPGHLAVTLNSMQSLQCIEMDALRPMELEIVDAPTLQDLTVIDPNGVRDESLSGRQAATHLRGLRLVNCPSLNQLDLTLVGTQRLDLSGATGLRRLSIGGFTTGPLGIRERVPLSHLNIDAVVDQVLDQIGCDHAPQELSFVGLDLRTTDLSRLTTGSTSQLQFVGCLLAVEQIVGLRSSPHLVSLDLGDLPLTSGQLRRVLSKFPNLETFAGDVSPMETFTLPTHCRLRQLRSPPMRQLRRLELPAGIMLETCLNVDHELDVLRLPSPTRLTGLAISQPFPSDAVVGPFRDLQYFVVGGRAVGDAVIDALTRCETLQQLMIAYSSVSPRKWEQIGSFESLRSLSVPGAAIDDDVIKAWAGLDQLWSIDLSHTRLTAAVLQWLSTQRSLRYLNLNDVDLDASCEKQISRLGQVTHLSIAGVDLPSEQFAGLANLPIEYLDLSRTKWSAEIGKALCSARSLRTLILNDVDVSAEEIVDLILDHGDLSIDLGRGPLAFEVASQLDARLDRDDASKLVHEATIYSQQEIRRGPSMRRACSSVVRTTETVPAVDHAKFDRISPNGLHRIDPPRRDGLFLQWTLPRDSALIAPPLSRFPPKDWLTGKADQFRGR